MGEKLKKAKVPKHNDLLSRIIEGEPEGLRLPLDIVLWADSLAPFKEHPPNMILIHQSDIIMQIEGDAFFTSHDGDGNPVGLSLQQKEWLQKNVKVVGEAGKDEKNTYPLYGILFEKPL
ncbi:hypothetical protein IMZ31_22880 (plasmid) [Pontibacillus sp. ALD_SL1]|uniref:hypothetical protein n=1 Tax=Pontibacillus sp. ALD_SL1 TaxID=2777185 RepID=UPI001A95CF06|nr:hypothetical protein [Pontibacillus sp. ALD_SL1]QST02301.1 hypothetical protein IMZ31_22880 [Pontibacillus sp. ALD_SL1]